MVKSKKLVFFGTEKFSTYALESLLAKDWNVIAVVTKPDSPSGRGRQMHSPEVKRIANKNSIPVFQPSNQSELIDMADKFDTDVAVLSAYGKIIPKKLLEHFKLGIINIHPSLLPKHRGASPIEQTIIDGDEAAGVSLMRLVEKMDAGPVYAQQKLPLSGSENAGDLYSTLGSLGADLLVEKLPDIVDAKLRAVEQNDSGATYTPMIQKSDGVIDWNEDAETVERKVRAYVLWPCSKTTLSDKSVTITKAHLMNRSGKPGGPFVEDGQLGVGCKTGSIIIDRLKPDGKREMSSSEFLAGNPLFA